MKNKAFTLAEIMIVLTVIGVLSAILLPVASNSMPDKNVIKFKKAYNDFSRVIRDLISSGEYYLPGDLGKFPDGTKIDGSSDEHYKYFCKTVADSLATKSVDCEALYGNYAWGINHSEYDTMHSVFDYNAYAAAHMDYLCNRTENASASYIQTVDDIYIINHSPYTVFFKANIVYYLPDDEDHKRYVYKITCIDLDEPQKGIKSFAIGFRRDGKIKLGERAKWWLERDITKKETDCCPLGNVEYNSGGSTVNLCDDGDTICSE